MEHPDKMFAEAVGSIKAHERFLRKGYIYRGEYLKKPKHNCLAYDRIPRDYIILFDIETDVGRHLRGDEFNAAAHEAGYETVMQIEARINKPEDLLSLLEIPSHLGGQKIEGVVIKSLSLSNEFGGPLMAKYVSEKFKEVQRGEWREANPTQTDITHKLIAAYRTPARWNKAIQHLRERGQLTNAPTDIAALIKEVSCDVHEECSSEIKQILFNHFWKDISRGITRGLAEWYKEELLALTFGVETSTIPAIPIKHEI